MTSEEAKEFIVQSVKSDVDIAKVADAIQALKQQPNRCDSCTHSEEQDGSNCYECVKGMADNFEAQPSEDCISREAVKEMLSEEWTKYMPMELDINLSFVMEKINELPSVTPQQRIGYWEYVQYDNNPNIGNWHCSECRGICREMHSIKDAYNYCPNCGADMRGDSE